MNLILDLLVLVTTHTTEFSLVELGSFDGKIFSIKSEFDLHSLKESSLSLKKGSRREVEGNKQLYLNLDHVVGSPEDFSQNQLAQGRLQFKQLVGRNDLDIEENNVKVII